MLQQWSDELANDGHEFDIGAHLDQGLVVSLGFHRPSVVAPLQNEGRLFEIHGIGEGLRLLIEMGNVKFP